MKQEHLIEIFNRKPDKEKVEIILRALQIKRVGHTNQEAILLASGFYRDIENYGNWVRNEGERK